MRLGGGVGENTHFDGIQLHPAVPDVVIARFERARKLHLFAWFDGDLIKAGELVALSAQEHALRDRYGGKFKRTKGDPPLADLLKHMPKDDGLTNDKLPFITRVGGSVISRLDGTANPHWRRYEMRWRTARRFKACHGRGCSS